MSKIVGYPLALVGFGLLGWSGILALQEVTGMKVDLGPLAVIIGGLMLAAAGVVWHIHSSNAQIGRPGLTAGAQSGPLPASSPGKNTISIGGSNNQVTIGHIGDVTINQAPRPELKLSAAKVLKNEDGTYNVTSEAEIVSPYPPGSLRLEAWAPGIISLEAIPQRTGISMTGHSGVRPDFAFTTLMQPFGKYHIVVRVKEPTNIDLKYDFDR
jgi:hypothetical protein